MFTSHSIKVDIDTLHERSYIQLVGPLRRLLIDLISPLDMLIHRDSLLR